METTIDRPKTSPKDFFLYLGVALTLYASAGALLALLFSITNSVVPDALNPQYYSSWAGSGIRFSISMLLVAFPIYLVLSWFIRKDIAANVAKYQLAIRKWFIYFTLFIAGGTIAGDVIALVNVYLGGEVSARFIWKMLSVLVVAGVVFAYYFYDIRRASAGDTRVNKLLIGAAIVGMLVAIIAGFITAGSPSEIRAMRFDETRTSHLSGIQWEILNYWQTKKVLPASLDALNDDFTGFFVNVDPETGAAYEYSVKGPLSFELCATFTRASVKGVGSEAMYPEPWGPDSSFEHEAGRTCFTRTIDPLKYTLPR